MTRFSPCSKESFLSLCVFSRTPVLYVFVRIDSQHPIIYLLARILSRTTNIGQSRSLRLQIDCGGGAPFLRVRRQSLRPRFLLSADIVVWSSRPRQRMSLRLCIRNATRAMRGNVENESGDPWIPILRSQQCSASHVVRSVGTSVISKHTT